MLRARMRRAACALVTSSALLAAAHPARADDKKDCVAASEKAQLLRNAGKLTEAREQLVACGRAECPRLVQQDCTQWMSEVLSALPTVIPAAKDKKGRDVIDVKVTVDGKSLTDVLDGKAYPVDPGLHTFRFETKGAAQVEEQVVVRQAEKNRILPVTFALGDDVDKPVGGGGNVKSEERSGPPIVGFALAGAGLVGGGVALYLGLSADSDGKSLRDSCAPKCSQSQVDDIQSRQTTARVIAIAAGVVFAAGVALIVIHYASQGSKSGKAPAFPSDVIRF